MKQKTNSDKPQMRGEIELRFRTKDGINGNTFNEYSKPNGFQYNGLFVITFNWKLHSKNQTIDAMKGIVKTLEELPRQGT